LLEGRGKLKGEGVLGHYSPWNPFGVRDKGHKDCSLTAHTQIRQRGETRSRGDVWTQRRGLQVPQSIRVRKREGGLSLPNRRNLNTGPYEKEERSTKTKGGRRGREERYS